ncbi:hypothetical protein CQ012_12035 [Arthrobacter sp. MYb214]|nr:hypothetical protein CQ016_02215 [Arthrobacter sp. MYb222]PRB75259.1 hypothetical protein CQ012_12035 [Arthrobacter sp. MYb214]
MPALSANCRFGELLQLHEGGPQGRRTAGHEQKGFGYRNWHCRKTDSASFYVITRTFMRYLIL